ncbi:MAG: 50S ribosomal protein L22 [Candidatus Kaiserbacteria bacterium]|nr:50S ribosomal protein L22 [Candidatus Kaiserbacteria bacterium]
MKATLSNYRQSPQKVRLVANVIRGKSVPAARAALLYLPQKSSPTLLKLLNSAVANARTENASVEELFVKTVTVDKGAVLKRFMPKARGRAARFSRTMSIIRIELGTNAAPKAAKKAAKKVAAKKTAKKAAKKVAAKTE